MKNTEIDLTDHQWKDTITKKRRNEYHRKEESYRWIYTILATHTRKHNKQLQLTFQDFLEFIKIKNCYYCKKHIDWKPRSRYFDEHGSYKKSSQSYYLDRKDNSMGYLKENCVVCCSLCNKIKSNILSHNEMMLLSNGIREIHNLRAQSNIR